MIFLKRSNYTNFVYFCNTISNRRVDRKSQLYNKLQYQDDDQHNNNNNFFLCSTRNHTTEEFERSIAVKRSSHGNTHLISSEVIIEMCRKY